MKITMVILMMILIGASLVGGQFCLNASAALVQANDKIEVLQAENGRLQEEIERPFESPIDLDHAYKRMAYARRVHRTYVLNPLWCSDAMGSIAFHQAWVEDYDKILELLDYLRKGEK